MGQEVGVTPIQLISAVSAIANGGTLLSGRTSLRKCDEAENCCPAEAPLAPVEPRRVIRPETAATLRRLMEGVVLAGGTGHTGASRRLDRGRQNGFRAKDRSEHGTLFADAIHCVVHGFCADQQSGGDHSGVAGFAGGTARRRTSGRTGVQAHRRAGAAVSRCVARRAAESAS